jgi:hypothetical protein
MVFPNKEAIAFLIPPMKTLLSLQSFCNLVATLQQRDTGYDTHRIIKNFSSLIDFAFIERENCGMAELPRCPQQLNLICLRSCHYGLQSFRP